MDLSKFKVSDWLIIGGAVVMLILGLALKWATFAGESGNGPFDYFFTGGLSWLLVVGAGLVTFLLAAGTLRSTGAPWSLIVLAATGLATLLMLLRVILGGGEVEALDIELGRGPGMWIAFIAAAVALAGAVMKFTESGGNLRDLTDVDKLRDSFDRADDRPPPPPPPAAGTVPPPPPPPAV